MTLTEGHNFFSIPAGEKEVFFNSLSLADQISLTLMTPWEKRIDVMLLARDTTSLIQGIPVEELFWSVKASGTEDSIEILDQASPEQLQFFFDLDWWKKADLVPEKILSWLVLLLETDSHAINSWFSWIRMNDYTLIPSILRLFIHVHKRPDDMDIQEACDLLPPFTLDNVYYIAFKNIKLTPLLSRFIEKILATSPALYRDVLETMLWETGASSLEHSYGLKKSRLSDWGIPDYFEAIEIYAPLQKNKIRRIFRPQTRFDPPETIVPAFIPTLYMGDYPYLRKAVEGLKGSPEMERIMLEWVGVSNKIMIADSVDLDEPGAMKDALLRASALINLGLEISCHEEKKSPDEIISSTPLEDLVRLANFTLKKLSFKADKLIKDKIVPNDLSFIPDFWKDILKGLLFKRPLLWDQASFKYKTPSSMAEIHSAQDNLSLVEYLGIIIAQLNPHWGKWDKVFLWKTTNLKNPKEFTWDIALVTALAQKALGHALVICPVPEVSLQELRRLWFHTEKKDPITDVIAWAESHLEFITKKVNIPGDVVRNLSIRTITALYEELKMIPEDAAIDGRFITKILVELNKSH